MELKSGYSYDNVFVVTQVMFDIFTGPWSFFVESSQMYPSNLISLSNKAYPKSPVEKGLSLWKPVPQNKDQNKSVAASSVSL